MFNGRKNLFVILLAGALVVGLSTVALAQTPSGTEILNTATLDYSVNSTPQAQVISNETSFFVDNKVDLTVTTVDASLVSVIPGTFAQVLTYTVTNNGNTVQDYSLDAVPLTTAPDNFDATGVAVFVDTDDDNIYTPATDTRLYIDELMYGVTITVFVVADIPLAQLNGDIASYDLLARTAAGGAGGVSGVVIASDDSGTADDPTLVQIVFADTGNDGQDSSESGYLVVTADLEAVKSLNVLSDPFNLNVNPKAIPGATVGYQVMVNNNGAVTADAVQVIDSIPTNNSFLVGTVSTVSAAPATVSFSNDNGGTWAYVPTADPIDGTDPAVTHIQVIFASVANAATAQVNFSVLID